MKKSIFFFVLLIIMGFSMNLKAKSEDFSNLFRLAVFDIKSDVLDDSILVLFTDSLKKELKSLGLYYIIPKEDLKRAQKEIRKPELTRKRDYVRVGRRVGADKIFFGSINKINEMYEIKVKLYDIESKSVERQATLYTIADYDSIFKFVPAIIWKLYYPQDSTMMVKGVFEDYSQKLNHTKINGIITGIGFLSILIYNLYDKRLFYDDDILTPVDSLQISYYSIGLSSIQASFINSGYSARGEGISAYMGLADDPFCFLYNPASLARIESRGVGYSFITTPINSDISIVENSISYVDNLTSKTYYGTAIVTTTDGGLMSELTYYLSGAILFKRLWFLPKFSLGANLKFRTASFGYGELSEGEDRVRGNAHGFGIDIGGTANFTDYLVGGMALQDAYNYLVWNNYLTNRIYREDLPRVYRMGLAYKTERFIMTMDWFKSIYVEQSEAFSFGLEYSPFEYLSFRGGWFQDGEDQNRKKFSIGSGINYLFNIPPYGKYDVKLDYAFEYFPNLVNTHTFSFIVEF